MAPSASSLTLTLHPQLCELEKVELWLLQTRDQFGLSDELMFKLNVCIEEWFSNLVNYGITSTEPRDIELELEKRADEVVLRMWDHYEPYDPTKRPPPAKAESLETAKIGGQGVHLMATFSHHWEYLAGGPTGNVLTLHLR
jgi:anti-sigma regulatory factor (Ser/Thr protein kinase)